jgi:hypothetical protein
MPKAGFQMEAEHQAAARIVFFDREWAMALLDKVLNDLEREEPEFSKWKPFLSLGREELSYARDCGGIRDH